MVMRLRCDVIIAMVFAGTGSTDSLARVLVAVTASLPVFTF